ncbi:hypothetical protein DPMN_092348 [Dreissena polymorpha]|uniref:Uncharacterized protein n=1 Tax=Dreissena polymorpha TaxID=45954 RepID=A0A9D4R030_DREPO|nr:hypothetical protein DPMN_092348 [Dreissena polymorpha]
MSYSFPVNLVVEVDDEQKKQLNCPSSIRPCENFNRLFAQGFLWYGPSRLRAAEDDTKQLIDQLGGMGFDNPGPGSGENGRNSPYHQNGRDSPYQPSLVTRSLKLTLVNLQGDQKLNTKQDVREMKEKFQYAREAYEQEIGTSGLP